jgi:hypothetical protein
MIQNLRTRLRHVADPLTASTNEILLIDEFSPPSLVRQPDSLAVKFTEGCPLQYHVHLPPVPGHLEISNE